MSLKIMFPEEHCKVDNHLQQDLIKENYPSSFGSINLKCLLKQNHGSSFLSEVPYIVEHHLPK